MNVADEIDISCGVSLSAESLCNLDSVSSFVLNLEVESFDFFVWRLWIQISLFEVKSRANRDLGVSHPPFPASSVPPP